MTPEDLMKELREMLDQEVRQADVDYDYALFRQGKGEDYVMNLRPEDWKRRLKTAMDRSIAFGKIERIMERDKR